MEDDQARLPDSQVQDSNSPGLNPPLYISEASNDEGDESLPRSNDATLTAVQPFEETITIQQERSSDVQNYRSTRSNRNSSNSEDMFSSDGFDDAPEVDRTEAVIGEDVHQPFNAENSSETPENDTVFNIPASEDSNTAGITETSLPNSEDTSDAMKASSELSSGDGRSTDRKDLKRKDPDSDSDDGQTCSICLESWSNFGPHRLSSLKCGHLFGHSCIAKWLSQKPSSHKTCPTCKSLAKNKDLRFIYAKKVKVYDNYELVRAKSKLNEVQMEYNKLKLELYQADLHRDSLKDKNMRLEAELMKYKSLVPKTATGGNSSPENRISFAMELSLEITPDDSCRVFAYSNVKDDLLITQKVSSNIFPGYGVRRVNCSLGRRGILTMLHPNVIRDIAYSERNNLLLTASLDKTAKLFCDNSNAVITTLTCDTALWSCCWDSERPDRLYLGSVGGILQYDIRQPRSCVTTIQAGDFTPIVMLSYLPNGILSCHLNSIIAHRKTSSTTFESKVLPLEGPLLSARAIDSKVLISSRPNSACARGRHVLCDIDLIHDFYFSEKKVFYTGAMRKLMSRSCLMDVAQAETLAIADNESDSCVHVWKTSDGTRVQNISSTMPVIDTLPIRRGGESFLATLSQRSCKLYKAVFDT